MQGYLVVASLALLVGALSRPEAQNPLAPPTLRSPRLYVLDCGALIYSYPETYGLTRQEVHNTNMSVACYLVVHPRGTLLFDTGLADTLIGRPFNETPLLSEQSNPSTNYFMQVTRTLKSQLSEISVAPKGITFLALSHWHKDHVGNANDYASATWLVQKPDHDLMFGPTVPPEAINPDYRALGTSITKLLRGDHDVFGDGTVVLKATPGHTPGHQSLYVNLARTGGVVLSGDLYHYPEERTLGRMPDGERTTKTPESRASLEAFMSRVQAVLWIGHDINAFSRQKKAPAYYE